MITPVFRPLADDETPLLERATLGNLNWCGERFTVPDLHTTTDFAHYTTVDPARGDFGIVATVEDAPVGVVWAVFLPSDSPGYGFIDDETPEISVWVDAPFRGQGIGRRLIRQMISEARERGLASLSLSVEQGNHAERLYSSEGFVHVDGREDAGVMVARLTSPPHRPGAPDGHAMD
ncbi:GNAT family N-acetyltransferase [Propionibacterium acidifaciens]|uniref:GNAT family N-acetyltransferase n=1 Tax=Propionibacterium acidifaciens TaxID=556499 RepID=UPI0023F078CD|nr:GNAT family N-acetyltransferase [Propionibacterium acidifaciens]